MELTFEQVELKPTTNILNIEVPPQMEKNVPTGFAEIDRLFAIDGITPSTVALVTGSPGAGKSTLMTQLADSITKTGNVALYNAGEESLYQVRRTVNRLRLNKGFVVGQHRNVFNVLEHLVELQKYYNDKHVFLIQDSLQCLEMPREEGKRGRPLGGDTAALAALERITEWSKSTFGMAFVIGHVNKKNEFQGKNGVKHTIDCHLHLGMSIDDNGVGTTCAEMQKNRFGVAYESVEYDLTATGLKFRG